MNWNIFSLEYSIFCTWTLTSLKVAFWWRCSTAFTARPEDRRDEPKVWQGHGAGQVQAAGPGLRGQGGGGGRGGWGRAGGGGGGGTGEMAGRQELLGAAGRWTQAADGASFGILFGHDAAAATSFIIQVHRRHWGELDTWHLKKPDHLHACNIYQQRHIRGLQTCFRVLLQRSHSPSTVVKV